MASKARGGPFVTLRIIVNGAEEVGRRFQAIEDRARDFTPAWPAVQAEFNRTVADAFATQGASTGAGPWAPLAPETLAAKARRGFGAMPILQETQALMHSLTLPAGPEVLMMATPSSLHLGSANPRFKYHQSRSPRKRLPRRAPVELTADQKHAIVRPMRRYLTGEDEVAPVRGKGPRRGKTGG